MEKGTPKWLIRLNLFATCHMGNADVRGMIALLFPKMYVSAHVIVPPSLLWWLVAILMVHCMVKLEDAVEVLQWADICTSYRNYGSNSEEVRKSKKRCRDLVLAEISGTGNLLSSKGSFEARRTLGMYLLPSA